MKLSRHDWSRLSSAKIARSVCALMLACGPALANAAWVDTASKGLPVSVAAVPMTATATMEITVALKLRDPEGLKELALAVNTPNNPAFGRFLTPAQFLDLYAPSPASTQTVMEYLAAQGFSNISLGPNHTLIKARGTAAVVQQAFNTSLVQFPYGGKVLFVNTSAAQVPQALGDSVLAVLGLTNIQTAQTMLDQARAAGKQVVFPGVGQPVPNDTVISPANFNASQFRSAYNAGTTPTASQTTYGISTEGDLSQVVLDLRQYEMENNLPQVPYEIITIGTTAAATGIDEWDLDSQTSSGIAGDVQKMLLYNSSSLGDPALYAQVNMDNRVKALNMSYGGCETLNYALGSTATDDVQFMQGVAQGITYFASSGDGGAACSVIVNSGVPLSGIPDVEYPASSPYVVAVGGTSLTTNTDGSYNSEMGWDDSGGGTSTFETAPTWQNGIIPTSATGLRGVPDMAMEAGGQAVAATGGGAAIVVSGADTGVAGTSLSSPLAVGSWARMESAHGNCLGFAAPILYTYVSGQMVAAKDFNDVTLGTNGIYLATTGWDYVTGLGSFNITKVNADLPICAPALVVPLAAIVADATSGNAPLTVNFDASTSSTSNTGATISSYAFDFGDGSAQVVQATPTVSHVYQAAGSYTATVTVTDSDNQTSTNTAQTVIQVVSSSTPPVTTPPVTSPPVTAPPAATASATTPVSADPRLGGGGAFGFGLLPLLSLGLLRRRRR